MPLVVPTKLTAQPVVPLVQVCRPDLRAGYPGDMDEPYYLRQAEQERKRLEGHQRKVTQADKAVAKASAAADKAAQAAEQASSPSTAKSKRSEAERQRAAAGRARDARAKASSAVAASQVKINDYEKKAREAAAKRDKKERVAQTREQDRAQRAADDDRRARQRDERERAARDAAQDREVLQLRARTDELEQRLHAARLAAPKQICVLFVAGTIEGGKYPLRLDREIREIDLKVRGERAPRPSPLRVPPRHTDPRHHRRAESFRPRRGAFLGPRRRPLSPLRGSGWTTARTTGRAACIASPGRAQTDPLAPPQCLSVG